MAFVTTSPNPWILAGLESSLPNIEPDAAKASNPNRKTKISSSQSTDSSDAPLPPPCKILRPPKDDSESPQIITADEAQDDIGFSPQILVFRYRNKIHAIDHSCPHRNYPLSRGSISDIEDFGIILSAAITCPGHGWAFDLFTGDASRGGYSLGLWEVELRTGDTPGDRQVWIRKKENARLAEMAAR